MKRILILFLGLLSLTSLGQTMPISKTGSEGILQEHRSGIVFDSLLTVPVRTFEPYATNIDSLGRVQINIADSLLYYNNGEEWTTPIWALISSDGVEVSGNNPASIGLAVPLKSDFSTNTFVGLNAGLNNTYLSSTQGAQNTFIGTEAGRSNTTGYAQDAVGYGALYKNTTGNGNVALGYQALYENITNNFNTAVGTDAGYRNTGDRNNYFGHHSGKGVVGSTYITGGDNMFFGWETGTASTSGSFNSFFGNRAGFSHTTGSHNTAVGYLAGFALTTGSMNTFIGREAGQAITTQNNNVINGYRAGYNLASAGNTIVGFSAGFNTTSGSGNTFFGSGAGDDIITGSANTFLGQNAGNNALQSTSANFSTAIGKDAYTTKSNQMVLGHSGISETLLRGTVLLNTETDNAGGAKLQVNGKVSVSSAPVNADDVPRKLELDLKADKLGASDIEITDPSKGLILEDTVTGTRYRIQVTSGVITASAMP